MAALKDMGAKGAVVSQRGPLDISGLLAEGYTLGETRYVAGKRLRVLIPPGGE